MGNIQTRQSEREQLRAKMDKEKLYQFFGLRLANEGDGYDINALREYEMHTEQKPHDGVESPRLASGAVDGAVPIAEVEAVPPVDVPIGASAGSDGSDGSATEPAEIGNPGTMSELHRRCHNMLPLTFDGFRLNVNSMLGSKVSVGHALEAGGNPQMSDCRFSCSFLGNQVHPVCGDSYPLLIGEIDGRGHISATVMHYLTGRCRGRMSATVLDSVVQSSRLNLDYFGTDYTCSIMLSNLDLERRMGVMVASYLQQVTAQLALGVDVIYQRDEIVPGGEAALVSGVARYQQGSRQWSAMFSPNAFELCYTQMYGQNLGASVQLQADVLKRQAVSRLFYHCFIPQMGFSFRGGIDTHGTISAVCEKRIQPLPIVLQMSSRLNHVNNHFRFGLGLILG